MAVYYASFIGKCTIGVVVKYKTSGTIGHIVGFDTNNVNEVIVKVQFCDGKTLSIHPGRLEFLS